MSKDDDEVVLSRFVWLTSCSDEAAETEVEADSGTSSVVLVTGMFCVEPPPRSLRGNVKGNSKMSLRETRSDRRELCDVCPVDVADVGTSLVVKQDVVLLENPLWNLRRTGAA
jgi:hypothetical protein